MFDTSRVACDYIVAHAIQLYLGGMFTLMSFLRFVETNELAGGVWWTFVYTVVAHAIAAGLIWPHSRRLVAATGAVIIVAASARIYVIGAQVFELLEFDPANAARGSVALLLWGLVVVIGLRWPRVVYDSEVKALLQEAQDDSAHKAPDLTGGEHGVV